MQAACAGFLSCALLACGPDPASPNALPAGFEAVRTSQHALLRANVVLTAHRFTAVHDGDEIVTLDVDGTTTRVRSMADLHPHLVPIESVEQALEYVQFLREFEIAATEVPGLPWALPTRPGVHSGLESMVSEFGIRAVEKAEARPGGFILHRAIVDVVQDRPRLLMIEEDVGQDGTYAFRVLRIVAEGDAVRPLVQ